MRRHLWAKMFAAALLSSLVWGAVAVQVGFVPVRPPAPPPEPSRSKMYGEVKTRGKSQAIRRVMTWAEMVTLAKLDALQNVPREQWTTTRYLMFPDPKLAEIQTASLILNFASRGLTIVRPQLVGGGHLLRIGLKQYGRTFPNDTLEWQAFWELMAFDPVTSLIITRDIIDLARQEAIQLGEIPKQKVKRWVKKMVPELGPTGKPLFYIGGARDGQPCMIEKEVQEIVEVSALAAFDSKDVDAIRINPRHMGTDFALLQEMLGTVAPVLDARYFKMRVGTTIKDENVFRVVFGGLYYEFKGVRLAKDVLGKDTKATDLDLFFEDHGIGNIKAGVNFDAFYDKLRSDERYAMLKSEVTGDPREVIGVTVPSAKKENGKGWITGDIRETQIDHGDRIYKSLLTPRRAAREALFPNQCGLVDTALFDGKGARQDEAPFDVVNDTTVPHPFRQRLQAGPLGCYVCHMRGGDDGWMPLKNDVRDYMNASRKRLGKPDLFNDLSSPFADDAVFRIAGAFSGNFDTSLSQARDAMAKYVLMATGPMQGGRGDQTDVCRLAGAQLQKDRDSYRYNLVDAQQALLEMGWDVPIEQAVEILSDLIPPVLSGKNGFVKEDPTLLALVAGQAVKREDFALSFGFLLDRAVQSRKWQELLDKKREKR